MVVAKAALTLELMEHSIKSCPADVAKAAAAIIRRILEYHGEVGPWRLKCMSQTVMRHQHSVIRLKRADKDGIRLLLRPGDNSTCHEWRLTGPQGYWHLPVVRFLGLWSGWDGKEIPDAVLAITEEEVPDPQTETPGNQDSTISEMDRILAAAARVNNRKILLRSLDLETQEYSQLLSICSEEKRRLEEQLKEKEHEWYEIESSLKDLESRKAELTKAATDDREGAKVEQFYAMMQAASASKKS